MKKKDMYIDYKRSFKKRGRRRSRLPWIILTLVLVAGLSVAAFYSIKLRLDRNELVADAKEQNPEQQPLPSPTVQVTITPTPTPTIAPTPTAIPIQEDVVEAMDTRVPVKAKGIYVTSSIAGSTSVDALISLAEETEVNAMVIDIKDDLGKITYKMDSAMAQEIGATTNTIDDIASFIKKLKEHNIYLIARIVAFKDPYLADKKKELAIKNKDGSLYLDNNGEGWVNPYNHKVWDYLIEVASQAAAVGFDEIQFDYIRFSTGNGMAKADFGKNAKEKTKQEVIIEFTKYAYESLKPLGVYVSADVYGTIISSSIDAELVGQNYVEMAKYLDYICPMIYPSHFGEGNYGIQYPDLEPLNIIRKALTASSEKLDQIPKDEHRAIVRPWLQDFTATWIKHHMKYGADELREQISGVYGAGYEEWLLWNAGCKYSEDGLLSE
ncbi:MAG: putative rane protein [Firmicutes bacterium]|nr:putative rane protein [Bacillota bacterium]